MDGITLSNTFLHEKRYGWDGICIEANPDAFVHYGDASFNNENEQQNIIRIRSRPLATILEENGSPKVIDYLSIDVEGSEERILPSFPFSRYCFSHDDHRTSKQTIKRNSEAPWVCFS